MGRAVRVTRREEIEKLSDDALETYIAETKRRVAAMTNAALRNSYRKQLLVAQQIRAERESCA